MRRTVFWEDRPAQGTSYRSQATEKAYREREREKIQVYVVSLSVFFFTSLSG